jgi:tRNA G18 (ribose-2'-O)-methylase SpoU
MSRKIANRISRISRELCSSIIKNNIEKNLYENRKIIYSSNNHDKKLNIRDEFRSYKSEEITKYLEDTSSIHAVLCINVEKSVNIGVIERTAHLFGISKVYIIGFKHFDRRGNVGTQNYIKEEFYICAKNNVFDVEKALEYIKILSKRYTLVCIEQGGRDVRNVKIKSCKPLLFIVGEENRGIPLDIFEYIKMLNNSLILEIPQKGIIRSYNVNVAFSIVAWELLKDNF